ncbi:MAG: RluA family pseudouridine synthase [Planctomycetes bacterium]|nr:RluA family pseudouridine synthase [Planctomycetota bacterium]
MDRERNYTATAADEGKRLDNILRRLMPDVSLGRIAKLVRKKRIRVNDAKSRHQQRVHEGDVITFVEAPMEEAWTKKGRARVMSGKVAMVDSLDFTVLYEDEHMLAVAKPAGLLVHGSLKEPNAPTLIDQVLAYVAQKQVDDTDSDEESDRSLSEFVRPSPTFQPSLAHRIDRHTSGVVLIAKTIECLQELTRMIRKRAVDKYYIGLVKGGLAGGSGVIDAPVSRRDQAGKKAGRHKVDVGRDKVAAKPSITKYKTLAQRGTYSLVEFELITGRTHQIRAHLRHVGSALIGDDEYGDRTLNRHVAQNFGLKRQFLHAMRVVLDHPMREGERLDIVAPLPDDLAHCLDQAGFESSALPQALQEEFEESTQRLGGESDG